MKYTNTEIDSKKVGRRIEKLRLDSNLSIEDFCSKIGISSRSTYYNWIKGKSEPEPHYFYVMCNLFDCDMGYLLCEPEYTDKRSRRNADIYNVTGLSDRAIQNIKKMRGQKNLFGERDNRLNLLLENKDIIPLLEDIEHYVLLKSQKNPDDNALKAEAYSLYRKFMNIIDT